MRFMMFMYPQISEEDWNPSAEDLAAMTRYNIELREAGMLLALDGLRPPSDGASVVFEGSEARVVDGPFAETKEVVGGYWIIQADSTEEALEWAKQCRESTVGSRSGRSGNWRTRTSPRTSSRSTTAGCTLASRTPLRQRPERADSGWTGRGPVESPADSAGLSITLRPAER